MNLRALLSLTITPVARAFRTYQLRHRIHRIDRQLDEILQARRHDYQVERYLLRERLGAVIELNEKKRPAWTPNANR